MARGLKITRLNARDTRSSHFSPRRKTQAGFRGSTQTQPATRRSIYGPLTTRMNQLDTETDIQPRFLDNVVVLGLSWIVPGFTLAYIHQHYCPSLTSTPDGAPPRSNASTIQAVTPITWHQSQITGESTCSMRWCIPSANRLIHSTSLTTSMIWFMFVNLAPRSRTPTRVTLRQVQIRKIQQETQDLCQERVQEQVPASGARHKAVCKETRCWSAHPIGLSQCATSGTVPRVAPNGYRQVVLAGAAVPLVVFLLLLSNDKGFLWLFCTL